MGLMHIYAELDNPRCGMTRKSSKYNWNLVKAELGHVRRITQKIRDPLFIYGKPGDRGALGVKEVIVHMENVPPSQDDRYGPDFKKMNKIAAINHYTKSYEQRAARERFYFHIKPKHTLNTKWRLPSDKNPNHRYGLSIPGEGGFAQLIGGAYQDEWIEMNEYFKSKYPDKFTEPPARNEIISNRATDMQQQVVRNRLHPLPPKPRFILSRFKNVSKKIDMVNNTPLKRTGPFHTFYGIKGANKAGPVCEKGIHR
ncbi:hypothetical protein M758_4G269200 [Ceratodon purpureus]|nr:hypothetical protein M758_4G269200 [Ceratodon purpureus]